MSANTVDSISKGQVWDYEDFGEVLVVNLERNVESYNPVDDIALESDRIKVEFTDEWDDVGAAMGEVVTIFASTFWEEAEYSRDAEIWDPMNGDDWDEGPPDDLDIGGSE